MSDMLLLIMTQYNYSVLFLVVLLIVGLIISIINNLGFDIGQYSSLANLDISSLR